MLICKDCIHYNLCMDKFKKQYSIYANKDITVDECEHFKNKTDVEEVKHGEWIDKFNGKYANPTYVCSICGERALLEMYRNELDQWRYRQSLSIRCPHCGVKMDGGKTE